MAGSKPGAGASTVAATGGVERVEIVTRSGARRSYTPEEKARLRPLLRAMVQPGKGATPDTRRRVRLTELVSTSELEAARHLIEPLIVERLVTVDHAGEAGESIELTHEALIEKWGTRRRWLDEDREELRLRRELEEEVA